MVSGLVEPAFESVRQVFTSLWDDIEVGAAITINLHDRTIVDLKGGWQDRAATRAWQHDTLVNVYSASKGPVSMALACLVCDERLDYQAPVADYWPEFGAEQKFAITVAQLISHQAGLHEFDPPVTAEALLDWQPLTRSLAARRPAWQPGERFGYHAITWGYLAGELILRITGQTPGQFIRDRITDPLGAAFHLGVPEQLLNRCAELIGPNHARKIPAEPAPHAQPRQSVSNDPVLTPFRHLSSAPFRSAEIPGSNGHASSQGLARCYQAALDGTLFPGAVLTEATAEVTQGQTDIVLGQRLRRAMGFILNSKGCYFGPNHQTFGHAGTGGTTAFADPETGISFAYVTNQLHTAGGYRSGKLIDALYRCL